MGFLMKQGLFILWLVAALSALDCSGLRIDRAMRTQDEDWTTEGGVRSRVNVAAGNLRTPMVPDWEYSAQAGLKGTPLVRDSVMILGTLNGELQAVNVVTGKRLGYKNFGAPIAGTPVLDGATVYLTTAGKDQTLFSYDLHLGKRLWEFPAGSVETSPLLLGETVVVAAVDGTVYGVEKSSGTQKWKYEIQEDRAEKQIHSSPASDGKLVAIGSDDGILRMLDGASGTLRWKSPPGASIFATPAFSGGNVLVGRLDGTIDAYDAASGKLRWTFDTGAPVYGGMGIGNGMVFVGSSNGVLYCLEDRTGTERWKFRTKSVINSAPLVTDDQVVVGSLDRTLTVLNAKNGSKIWEFHAVGRIKVSPVLWGDILLVTSEDKYVTALRPEQP